MVSIFTPTYNREKNIVNLYENLLKQTNKDFKWIIVDDRSTDRTSNVKKNIGRKENKSILFFLRK